MQYLEVALLALMSRQNSIVFLIYAQENCQCLVHTADPVPNTKEGLILISIDALSVSHSERASNPMCPSATGIMFWAYNLRNSSKLRRRTLYNNEVFVHWICVEFDQNRVSISLHDYHAFGDRWLFTE